MSVNDLVDYYNETIDHLMQVIDIHIADKHKLIAEFIKKLEKLRDFYHSYSDFTKIIEEYEEQLEEKK